MNEREFTLEEAMFFLASTDHEVMAAAEVLAEQAGLLPAGLKAKRAAARKIARKRGLFDEPAAPTTPTGAERLAQVERERDEARKLLREMVAHFHKSVFPNNDWGHKAADLVARAKEMNHD